MTCVDGDLADLLGGLDLAELGRRIRAARRAAGLTQAELAGEEVSVAYVSRIEAGQRRPAPAVLEAFAARLSVTPRALLADALTDAETLVGPEHGLVDELRLELDLAELALAAGQSQETAARSAEVISRTRPHDLPELRQRGHYLHALAAEHQGRLDEAILELEDLTADLEPGLLALDATLALSRCYRESGDLGQAVECAEVLLRRIDGTPLDHTDEAIKLAVTMALAHIRANEYGRAVRICMRALAKAEETGSDTALGAAYWNIAVAEGDRGRTPEAIGFAERALAHLRSGGTPRMRTMLRGQLAYLHIKMDPPEPEAALRYLDQSEDDVAALASDVRARRQTMLARAHLLRGDAVRARELAEQIRARYALDLPFVVADACSVQGQALLALGEAESAVDCFRQAVALLTGVGNDREVAQLWFELAVRLEAVGETDHALVAYRGTAAATGLTTPVTAPTGDRARL